MVGTRWSLDDFSSMEAIPSTVCLAIYDGGVPEFMSTRFGELAALVRDRQLRGSVDRTFRLDETVEAPRCTKEINAGGEIVVPTWSIGHADYDANTRCASSRDPVESTGTSTAYPS